MSDEKLPWYIGQVVLFVALEPPLFWLVSHASGFGWLWDHWIVLTIYTTIAWFQGRFARSRLDRYVLNERRFAAAGKEE